MAKREPSESTPINSREIYALLGEFLVKFQWLCSSLAVGIMLLDDPTGERKGRVTQALTVEMPPMALLNAFNAITRSSRELSNFETQVLDKLYSRIEKLIIKRNELIHGTWFIYDEEKFPYAKPPFYAFKEKHRKKGLEKVSITVSQEHLRKFVNEGNELGHLVLTAWISFNPNQSFESNFSISAEGNLERRVSL